MRVFDPKQQYAAGLVDDDHARPRPVERRGHHPIVTDEGPRAEREPSGLQGVPVVIDPDVQPGKDPFGQWEDLGVADHNIPKVFAALDFRENGPVKAGAGKLRLRDIGSAQVAVAKARGSQLR